MLTKQGKEILRQHDELHWLEKKITNNIRKLSNNAHHDLDKFFKSKKLKYKFKIKSLQTYMFSKQWKPIIFVFKVSPKPDQKEFDELMVEASEKIGLEIKYENY